MNQRSAQKGAALVIVLLLAATLALVLTGVVETTSAAARRAIAERARADLSWKALAAEAIAREALAEAKRSNLLGRSAKDEGVLGGAVEVAIGEGAASIAFADAGRCFNINSLVSGEPGQFQRSDAAVAELIALGDAIGVGDGAMRDLAAAAIDWIDSDVSVESGGAEDSYYTARPEPYRTGAGLFGSVSEIRALEGVSAELYRAVAPYLCAFPEASPLVLSANTLRVRDAPLVAALLGGKTSAVDIATAISERPPGGYASAEQFWSSPSLRGVAGENSRIGLDPVYIEARARLTLGDQELDETLHFALGADGEPRLIRRIFGEEW